MRGAPEGLEWLRRRRDYMVVEDRNGSPVVLAQAQWAINHALENAPGVELYEVEPL